MRFTLTTAARVSNIPAPTMPMVRREGATLVAPARAILVSHAFSRHLLHPFWPGRSAPVLYWRGHPARVQYSPDHTARATHYQAEAPVGQGEREKESRAEISRGEMFQSDPSLEAAAVLDGVLSGFSVLHWSRH